MNKIIKLPERHKAKNNFRIFSDVGLIAIILVILQDLISIRATDAPVLISLIAFSIALPALSLNIVFYRLQNDDGCYDSTHIKKEDIVSYMDYTGVVCAVIGVSAAIWHASWIAGILFTFFSITAFFILGWAMPETSEIDNFHRRISEKPEIK